MIKNIQKLALRLAAVSTNYLWYQKPALSVAEFTKCPLCSVRDAVCMYNQTLQWVQHTMLENSDTSGSPEWKIRLTPKLHLAALNKVPPPRQEKKRMPTIKGQ